MIVDPKDFKFDELTAAEYANPKAKAYFTPGPDGHHFKWEWEGNKHEIFIAKEKLVFPDLILEKLFEAAIAMANR